MPHPRFPLIPLALSLATMLASVAAPAARAQGGALAAAPVKILLAAQPLGSALNELARQAGLQLLVRPELVAGKSAPALSGRLTPRQALDHLLAGSGLAANLDGNAAVVVPAGGAGVGASLAEVRVTASADRENAYGPVSGFVPRRSATATKTDTPILEIPQSLSVIGREEMDARGAQDIMGAIAYTTGVTVNSYGPDNRGWEDIYLRGFGTYQSSYRDGLPQTAQGVTYYLTEPYGLERVEVLRGPASMTFGQGDAGGIINRVGKRPTGERLREVELQYGSFDRKQLAFDLGDRINDDLSFRLAGLGLDSNDQDQYPTGQKLNRTRAYLAPSLRWQPDASTSLNLFGEFLRNRSAEDPYFLLDANKQLTHVKMGDPSFSRIHQDQSSFGYEFSQAFNDAWSLRQNFRYTDIRLDRRVVWADSLDPDGHTWQRIARTWNDPSTQAALDTHLQGKLSAGGIEHGLLLGVDWNRARGKALRFIGAAPSIDLLAPVYNQPVASPANPLADYTQTIDQIGFYAQDQMRIGERWIFTVGARQDRVNSRLDDRLNASDTAQTDNAFSARAGLTFLAGNGWAPYVSYAESFLPNSGVDSNNLQFQPSRGAQVELGVKYQPEGSRTLLTAALFDLGKTQVVTYDPVTFDARQIGKQRSRGLELEAKTELRRGLNLIASYSWTDTRTVRSADPAEVGKQTVLVPRQAAALWLDQTLDGGFGFGAGVRHVGTRPNDEINSTFERGFSVVDAALRHESGPWRFALNVSNLFNRKYNSICYHGECYQGAFRTVTASLRYRF